MNEIEAKIIQQLNKDLSLAGYANSFSNLLPMKQNINLLVDWINIEVLNNSIQFAHFLYVIDLDESLLKSDKEIDNESLALLILTRLKNKVINREKYSNT
ncbi:MAG: hypothetical protein CL846_06955 [Crocinitomicaceae bacterium]|nr:hypothetical protein [Crocinitomicaceae bacterium]|tara:strand:- start:2852 stop:3151 length:300 start_codon:yes stop_codon:yes gene_type:complete